MSDEVLAGLKVLVAVAKADGVVHDNERLAIENALDGVDAALIGGREGEAPEALVQLLLSSEVDLDAALHAIKNPHVKQQIFDAVCAMVFVDGEASEAERAILAKIRAAFELEEQHAKSLRFKAALDRAFLPLVEAPSEGATAHRKDAIQSEIERFSLLGAALASAPLPTFAEGIDLLIQARLARKIGSFYGHRGDVSFWRTFVTNIVGSAGSRFAISTLTRLAGWGSSRPVEAYASTHALGSATALYFVKDEKVSPDELRDTFRSAKKDGQRLAKESTSKIDEKLAAVERSKRELDVGLANKTLSEDDYLARLIAFD